MDHGYDRQALLDENEREYRERTAKAADQFWNEVRAHIDGTDITFDQAKLAIRMMCGTPGWEAYAVVYPDQAKLPVMTRKVFADDIYQREDIQDFVKWAKLRSQELYALDIGAWDWSFKDSEMSLRLLIACSEEQLRNTKGVVTPNISSTILGAIRELNKMYEYDGTSYKADKAKAVIFLHEDALED